MVSTSKMVQLSRRIIQFILLCVFWELGAYGAGRPEYSSIRLHKEDQGEIIVFIIAVVIGEIGKKLDKDYKCPVYCGIDHKHYYWENYEGKKGNIQTDDGLSRPGKPKSGKQSESDLRPIASND